MQSNAAMLSVVQVSHGSQPPRDSASPLWLTARVRGARTIIPILITLLLTGCQGPDSVSVHIPKEQIQAQVASKFPIEKRELFLKAVFTDPRISLNANANRIGVDVRARIEVTHSAAIGGRVNLDGDLVYEPATGEFFIRKIRMVDARIDSVPPDVAPALERIGGISTIEYPFRAICRQFPPKISDIKIGQLPDDWKGRAAKAVVRRLAIKADGVDIEVGLPR